MKPMEIVLSNKGIRKNARSLVLGIGVNDANVITTHSRGYGADPIYDRWRGILRRCYSDNRTDRNMSYVDSTICEDWKYFSNFREWFLQNNVPGYGIDKDWLVKGNNEYSPEKCLFVPPELNNLTCSSKKSRGELPVGVCKSKLKTKIKYCSYGSDGSGRRILLGLFDSTIEAFEAYKKYKEDRIKRLAFQYYTNNLISLALFNAMNRYEVSIDD